MSGSVSGRSYRSTRVRGLAPWSPQRKTLELLERVRSILDEYADHLPLTARQIFYRLVGAHAFSKTEQAYDRLLEALNRARRAGMIDFDDIRDDGTVAEIPGVFAGKPQYWATVRSIANGYRLDPMASRKQAVEVWVEAGGVVPQVANVADEYGVAVFSSGGFDSLTAKHEAARRFLRRDRPTVVLHVSDHDPSGCSIIDSAADDIDTFVADYGQPGIVEWRRVAVTPEQIDRLGLPTAPQKHTDSRGEMMAATVQAEAIAPDQLAIEIRAALEAVLDLDVIAETAARSAIERTEIINRLDGLDR